MLRPVLLVWMVSVTLISVGLVGTGLSMFGGHLLDEEGRWVAGLLGWPSALVGPFVGMLGILRIVSRDEGVLQIVAEGLVIGADGTARTVGWSELSGVTWSRKGLILVHRSGSATQLPARWLGIGGADLAARLLEWRRRALLGVLRPPPR